MTCYDIVGATPDRGFAFSSQLMRESQDVLQQDTRGRLLYLMNPV